MRAAVIVVLTVIAVGVGIWIIAVDEPPSQTFEDPSEEEERALSEATVEQIVEDPLAWGERDVIVRSGRFQPLDVENGFVLEGDEASILVYAPGGAPALDAGDTVGVRAQVARFTEPAAEQLPEALPDAEQLDEVPTERGDPYLVYRAVAGTEAQG